MSGIKNTRVTHHLKRVLPTWFVNTEVHFFETLEIEQYSLNTRYNLTEDIFGNSERSEIKYMRLLLQSKVGRKNTEYQKKK